MLVAMLGILTAAGPLSTDMYLPSLPAIAVEFGTGTDGAQLTLSAFLIGFAGGQLIYGPISDRHGRRPVLLAGLALFIAATIGCMFATSIEALIALRMLQALGASGPVVLARAVARDLYSGAEAGRLLSLMGSIMGFVPAIAPVIGALIHVAFGWRAVFAVIALFGVLLMAATWARLGESLQRPNTNPLSVRAMARTFADLARDSRFRRYVATTCLTYGGLFAFISGSSFVLQGQYGVSPQGFGLSFAAAVVGYIFGTLAASRLAMTLGLDRTIYAGTLLLAGSGIAMVVAMLLDRFGLWNVLAPMIVYMFGVGLVLPQSLAGALTPFPDNAGAASSFLGFLQMTFASLVGIGVGYGLAFGPYALSATICLLGIAAFAVAHGARWNRPVAV